MKWCSLLGLIHVDGVTSEPLLVKCMAMEVDSMVHRLMAHGIMAHRIMAMTWPMRVPSTQHSPASISRLLFILISIIFIKITLSSQEDTLIFQLVNFA